MQTLKSTGLCLDVRAAPGNKFVDVSRYHHTITNNNVVTVKGMGDALGGGYDGATASLYCGNLSSLNITDAITIEAWVKFKTISPLQGIVCKDYTTSYSFYATGGEIVLRLFGLTPFNTVSTVGLNLIANQWYYIIERYDGSTIKIFVNGEENGSKNTGGSIATNLRDLQIGHGYSGIQFFNGTIFLARIYNRALPAYEILDHYYEYAPLLGLD